MKPLELSALEKESLIFLAERTGPGYLRGAAGVARLGKARHA